MKKYLSLLSAVVFAGIPVFSQERLSADELAFKAEQAAYYAGIDGKADVKMVIKDAGGQERVREFRVLRLNG